MNDEILRIKLPRNVCFLGEIAGIVKKYFSDAGFFEEDGYLVICGIKKKEIVEGLLEDA